MKVNRKFTLPISVMVFALAAGCAGAAPAAYDIPQSEPIIAVSLGEEPTEPYDVCRIVTRSDGVRTIQCPIEPRETPSCGASRDNPCRETVPAEVCGTSRRNPCRHDFGN